MEKQRISQKQFEALKYFKEKGKISGDDKTIHQRTVQCLFNFGLVGWNTDSSGCSWGITGKGLNILK